MQGFISFPSQFSCFFLKTKYLKVFISYEYNIVFPQKNLILYHKVVFLHCNLHINF